MLCDNKKIGAKICKLKNLMYFCALFHRSRVYYCCCSSVVEHFLGKEEVTSSSLVNSSKNQAVTESNCFFLYPSPTAKWHYNALYEGFSGRCQTSNKTCIPLNNSNICTPNGCLYALTVYQLQISCKKSFNQLIYNYIQQPPTISVL